MFITNVGKMKASFAATILPVNGKKYEVDKQELEVGQTAVIDIKKLRDNRVPDWREIDCR